MGSRSASAAEEAGSRADVGRLGSKFGVLMSVEEAGGSALGVVEKAASGGGGMWWAGMPVDAGVGVSSAQMAVRAAFDRQLEAERKRAPKAAVDSRRRWEARWKARDAREKAAWARRLAEQDQGSGARPAQAGPYATCARQGSLCGFCRERRRLAC